MTAPVTDVEAVGESKNIDVSVSSASDPEPRNRNIVDFEEQDPEDPISWPYWRKVTIQLLCASMYMVGNFGTVIIAPAVPRILQEFRVSQALYSTLLISIWELGEVVGPFLAAPLSERYGRLPIYHTGNVFFVICSIASALSTNVSMLVAFRFLNGLTTTSMTLGPSIVGDCFPREERGKSMAVAIAIPLIGPFAAPAIGGYLAQRCGWRWCIWLVAILAGFITLLSALIFKETYKPILLERKARRLRQTSGNDALRSRYHGWRDQNSFLQSIRRPLGLMSRSPLIFVVPFYSALVYGISYFVLTTLAIVMQSRYGFSEGQTGFTFIARGSGNLIGMLFYGLTSDRYSKFVRQRRGNQNQPEDRLPLLILGAIFVPPGMLLYGWGGNFELVWIVPLLGTAFVGFSVTLTMLSAQNYLVDIFDLYSASAIAVANAFNALCGALLPLCGPPLMKNLGLGWGCTLLALVFAAWWPALVLLHHFGNRIRASHRFGVKEHPWSES